MGEKKKKHEETAITCHSISVSGLNGIGPRLYMNQLENTLETKYYTYMHVYTGTCIISMYNNCTTMSCFTASLIVTCTHVYQRSY